MVAIFRAFRKVRPGRWLVACHPVLERQFLGPNCLFFLGIWAQSSRQVLLNA